MDAQSPPKRVTRARAAKDTEPKTTKIITAAARARTAPSTAATASTKSTAAKRKVRDHDDELEEIGEPVKKATRGRPRKIVQTEPEDVSSSKTTAAKSTTRTTTRGRPAKKATESFTEPPAPKATRGRPKKAINQDGESPETAITASTTLKKTTRTRAATTTTTTKTSTTDRPAGRKMVKFAEPNKENEGPLAAKDSSAMGLRGRPARRGTATATRPAKAAPKKSGAEVQTTKPLSPKKVTQMPHLRGDSSEDELAGGDTPLKKLAKSPVKPPSHLPVVSPTKTGARFGAGDNEEEEDDNTLAINDAILNPPELGTQILGSPPRRFPTSPFKDAMKSPARKLGAVQLPGSSMKATSHGEGGGPASPSKSALLQSAAKRPQSPVKGLLFPSTGTGQSGNGFSKSPSKTSALKSPAKRAMPGIPPLARSPTKPLATVLDESPGMKTIMSSPERSASRTPSEKLLENTIDDGELDNDDVFSGPMASLKFPGRLSAVMPRQADQDLAVDTEIDISILEDRDIDVQTNGDFAAAQEIMQDVEGQAEEQATVEVADVFQEAQKNGEEGENHSQVDEGTAASPTSEMMPTTPAKAPTNPVFQLRVKDQHPELNWESEDDLSPTKSISSSTPAPFSRTPGHGSSPSKSRRTTMGLSSLADQFGSWATGSPAKPVKDTLMVDEVLVAAVQGTVDSSETEAVVVSPEKSSFFEEQMSTRDSPSTKTPLADADIQIGEPILEDIMITDEDVALAQEANDMSHLTADQPENREAEQSFSDSISEASQEYADENQMPLDPALLPTVSVTRPPVTPARPAPKMFHTTTKVPLKAADNSTPSPLKKKSFSASRVAPRRPDGPARSATVISYSPTKSSRRQSLAPREDLHSNPATPAKSDMWSSMGTPARTPRKDINPALLRGAVVFVDVHTSEGADASGLFIELLSQMGARCVKTWSWNPSEGGEAGATKCGITHVVYKDGGKRTMEKVRQTRGVVHCVGVTWVLE